MRITLWKAVAENLIKKHYGIELMDVGIDDASVAECAANGIRPHEEVLRLGMKYTLQPDQALGTPSIGSEREAIEEVQGGLILLGEGIQACPECGCRTDFEEFAGGKQHHICLNSSCGHEFNACFDDDADDESEAA